MAQSGGGFAATGLERLTGISDCPDVVGVYTIEEFDRPDRVRDPENVRTDRSGDMSGWAIGTRQKVYRNAG